MHIAEVLRHRERGQGNAKAGAGGLIHLPKDQGGLFDHARLGHLQEQVVTLTGTLPHSGEHRDTAKVFRNAVNHFLDQYGLAHTGATEQTNFAALDVGGEQVNHLDAGIEDLSLCFQLIKGRCLAVNAPPLLDVQTCLGHVERYTEGVPHVAFRDIANRHHDGGTRVLHRCSTHKAVGGLHRDSAHHVVADVLGNLKGQHETATALFALIETDVGCQRIEQLRHALRGELHVNHRAGDASNAPHSRSLGVLLGRDVGRGSHGVVLLYRKEWCVTVRRECALTAEGG